MAGENDVKKLAGGTEAESRLKLSKAEIQEANEKAIAAKKAAHLADINKRLQLALKTKTANEEIINNANKNSGEIKHTYNGMYQSPENKIKNADDRIAYLEKSKFALEHPELNEKKIEAENKIKLAQSEKQQNNTKDQIKTAFRENEIAQDDLKTPQISPKQEYAEIKKPTEFQEAKNDYNPFDNNT